MSFFASRFRIRALKARCASVLVCVMLTSFHLVAQGYVPGNEHPMKYPTLYRTGVVTGH
jgi:hypothetical protein